MKTLGKIGLFFGITFAATILLALAQQTLGLDTTVISLPQFGPGVAALVMVMAFKKDGVTLTVTIRGLPAWKYLAALGIPLVVPVMLFFVYSRSVAPLSVPPIAATSFITMLGGILLGAFGEEVGWRGYAQTLLAKQLNGLAGFLLVGALWGIWHVGNFQYGPVYMLFFVLATIGISAVMAWLLQGTGNSIMLATLFHFGVNAGYYILQEALVDVRLMALNGLVWLAAAALVVAGNKKAFLATDAQREKPPIVPESGATMPGA